MGLPAVFSVSTQPQGGGEELEIEWASDLVQSCLHNEAEFGELSGGGPAVAGQDRCALRGLGRPVPCAQALSCVSLLAIDSPPSVSFL